MCLICVDLAKGRLTSREARNNLHEVLDDISEEHFYEVMGAIQDKEKEEKASE